MNIKDTFHIQAGNILKKIYAQQKPNLNSSVKILEKQLADYLNRLDLHLKKKTNPQDEKRIINIIKRDNEVSTILKSTEYSKITRQIKELMDDVTLGLIFCIDGRIPAVFLGGRFASQWEIPAAELKITHRKSDNNPIPKSSELCEALRLMVNQKKELLEIVFAHTSLSNPTHGCGAMAAKRAVGQLNDKLTNEEANLKIIEATSIPAITNIYNEFRIHENLKPLNRVGIPALYDTDTFGIALNYDRQNQQKSLSTTILTEKYKKIMDENFTREDLSFGSFGEIFTDLKYLVPFSQIILTVTEKLLVKEPFKDLQNEIEDFIKNRYPDLTSKQQNTLKIFLTRTIAVQYLTGSSTPSGKNTEHPFTQHEEKYMAVSTRGVTIGKFDPQNQGFSSTPSDPQSAIANIKTELTILNSSKNKSKRPHLLFVCDPVSKNNLKENSIQLQKVLDANSELFRAILADKELWELIKSGEIIPVSVLIKEDTREILRIIDQSIYI